MIWHVWWVWVVVGLAVATAELLLPGYIFLGFAVGGILTGGLIGIGLLAGASLSVLLAVFAGLSLLAWAGFRAALGKRDGQVKVWTRDINDND